MSLNRRLLLSASFVLFVFLGLTGFVLDRAFYHSAEQAVRERLQGQVYSMLAAADFDENKKQIQVTEPLPDPKLSSHQSGLYASIYTLSGQLVWKSKSSLGMQLPRYRKAAVAQWHYEQLSSNKDQAYSSVSFAVVWEDEQAKRFQFNFQVLEDYKQFKQQISQFRNELWGWLSAVTFLLLLTQGVILRWSLKPLREVADDLLKVKSGEMQRLSEHYPEEISGLTEGINTFIDSERSQRDRYRNTLADLAHSLKTPLTVLKAGINRDAVAEDEIDGLQDQVDRMREIVDYQLQRASASGRATMGASTLLLESIERIVSSLNKVHAEKGLHCQVQIKSDLAFPGEEGDLFELMGNLLENAFKWSRGKIKVVAEQLTINNRKILRLSVEDDGNGVPEEKRQLVLQRGKRADETVTGHGIGLSVVQEIVAAYQGKFTIAESELYGGAKMVVEIPLI